METAVSIIIGIVVLGLLVFFHELGHFIVAKICGIGVIEFSLGMGPRLFSFQIGETKYSLKAFPFGGSCAMVGEDAAGGGEIDLDLEGAADNYANLPDNAFHKKPLISRILTVVAGPFFNFLIAFIVGVILTACAGNNPARITDFSTNTDVAIKAGLKEGDVITSINGKRIYLGKELRLNLLSEPLDGSDITLTYLRDGVEKSVTYSPTYESYMIGITYDGTGEKAVLSAVTPGLPADEAGLVVGDIIKSIDGREIDNGSDLALYYNKFPISAESIDIVYERGGAEFATSVKPRLIKETDLGFYAYNYREDATFSSAISGGFREMLYGAKAVIASFKMIINGTVGVKDLSGPVGIVGVISDTVKESSQDGLLYVVLNIMNIFILLSTNLGIMNMLPIPALDGGRFFILLIEAVTRKRPSPRIENTINMIGFVLLMILMAFILVNDITKFF